VLLLQYFISVLGAQDEFIIDRKKISKKEGKKERNIHDVLGFHGGARRFLSSGIMHFVLWYIVSEESHTSIFKA
jgi:hypothetical protein